MQTLNLSSSCAITATAGLNNLLSAWGGGLRKLNLSYNCIYSKDITAACPNLESLNFDSCKKVSAGGLNKLLRLWGGRLKELNLCGTKITGKGIVGNCPSLEVLLLSFCDKLTDAGLDNLLGQWGKHLQDLDLTCTQGWKFTSCCHCQDLAQQASWLLIGYTRVNNQS